MEKDFESPESPPPAMLEEPKTNEAPITIPTERIEATNYCYDTKNRRSESNDSQRYSNDRDYRVSRDDGYGNTLTHQKRSHSIYHRQRGRDHDHYRDRYRRSQSIERKYNYSSHDDDRYYRKYNIQPSSCYKTKKYANRQHVNASNHNSFFARSYEKPTDLSPNINSIMLETNQLDLKERLEKNTANQDSAEGVKKFESNKTESLHNKVRKSTQDNISNEEINKGEEPNLDWNNYFVNNDLKICNINAKFVTSTTITPTTATATASSTSITTATTTTTTTTPATISTLAPSLILGGERIAYSNKYKRKPRKRIESNDSSSNCSTLHQDNVSLNSINLPQDRLPNRDPRVCSDGNNPFASVPSPKLSDTFSATRVVPSLPSAAIRPSPPAIPNLCHFNQNISPLSGRSIFHIPSLLNPANISYPEHQPHLPLSQSVARNFNTDNVSFSFNTTPTPPPPPPPPQLMFAHNHNPFESPYHQRHIEQSTQFRKAKITYGEHKRQMAQCVSSTSISEPSTPISISTLTATSMDLLCDKITDGSTTKTATTTATPITNTKTATAAIEHPAAEIIQKNDFSKDRSSKITLNTSTITTKTTFFNKDCRSKNEDSDKSSSSKAQFKIPKLRKTSESSTINDVGTSTNIKSDETEMNESSAADETSTSTSCTDSEQNGRESLVSEDKFPSTTKESNLENKKTKKRSEFAASKKRTESIEMATSSSKVNKIQAEYDALSSESSGTQVEAESQSSAYDEQLDIDEGNPKLKKCVEGILLNMFQPNNQNQFLSLLEKVLDKNKFTQVKDIITNDKTDESTDDTAVTSSTQAQTLLEVENMNIEKPAALSVSTSVSELVSTSVDVSVFAKVSESASISASVSASRSGSVSASKSTSILASASTSEATRPARKKKSNELSRLNDDIRTMFISEGVLTANGRRMCTVSHKEDTETTSPLKKTRSKSKLSSETPKITVGDESTSVIESTPPACRVLRRRTTTVVPEPIVSELEMKNQSVSMDSSASLKKYRRKTVCETNNASKETIGESEIGKDESNDAAMSETKRKRTDPEPKNKGAKKAKPDATTVNRLNLSTECKLVLDKAEAELGVRVTRAKKRMSETITAEIAKTITPSSKTKRITISQTKMASDVDASLPAPESKCTNATIKNTDRKMTIKMAKQCVFCDFKSCRLLVNHYANSHKDHEIFNARMSEKLANQLRKKSTQMAKIEEDKISAFCYYCESQLKLSRDYWISHLTQHTGEYRRQCTDCGNKLVNFQKPTQNCSHSNVKILNTFQFNGSLNVFMCNLCNFSQIMEKNVQNHLCNMHDITGNLSEYYRNVDLIANFKKSKVGQKSKAINEMDESVVSSKEPANQDVFKSSKQDDGLFDTMKLIKENTFNDSSDAIQANTNTSIIDRLSKRFKQQDAEKMFNKTKETNDIVCKGPENVPNAQSAQKCVIDSTTKSSNSPSADVHDEHRAGNAFENVIKKAENTNQTIIKKEDDAGHVTDPDDINWESCSSESESDGDNGIVSKNAESINKNKLIASTLTRLYSVIGKPKANRLRSFKAKKRCGKSKLVSIIGRNEMIPSPTSPQSTMIKSDPDEATVKEQQMDYVQSEYGAQLNINVETKKGPEAQGQSSSSSSLASSSSTSSQPPQAQPAKIVIKCRRISGDKLSSLKNLQLTACQIPAQQQALVISSVATLSAPRKSSLDGIVARSTVPNLCNVLKPWTTCRTGKSEISTEKLSRDVSLVALFKCMAINCIFSTNDADTMLVHLNNHEDLQINLDHQTNLDTSSWLKCSYCEEIADSCKLLVTHIESTHKTSIFQCAHCFYRSVDPNNVDYHMNHCHSRKKKLILICGPKRKHLDDEINDILLAQQNNVIGIECAENGCNKVLTHLFDWKIHISLEHPDSVDFTCFICQLKVKKDLHTKHLYEHNIRLFHCVYCKFGCSNLDTMRSHMSYIHSMKLPYSLIRLKLKTENSFNQPSIIYLYEEFNENLLHTPSLTEKQLNFMKPSLSEYSHNAGDVPTDNKIPKFQKNGFNSAQDLEFQQFRKKHTENKHNIKSFKELLQTAPKTDSSMKIAPGTSSSSSTANATKILTLKSKLPMMRVLTAPNSSVIPTIAKPLNRAATTNPSQLLITNVVGGADAAAVTTRSSIQTEIDLAAKSLVSGSGFEGLDLYRCGFLDCTFSSEDEKTFQVHLPQHQSTDDTFRCFHCGEEYVQPAGLINHIHTHGKHRFFCYCCNVTTSTSAFMNEHFKNTHKYKETRPYALNSNCLNFSKDMFVVCPRHVLSIKNFAIKLVERNNAKILATKKYYLPEEVNMLPKPSIYTEPVACQLCSYSSKVKANIYRHLLKADCAVRTAHVAPMDPVNPVPCLDTGEKHSDKMKNLAASSNTMASPQKLKLPCVDQSVQFVPEERRYVCGAKSCYYQTQIGERLRQHINVLHESIQYYFCPHCNVDLGGGKKINAIEILNHLRFHGTKLFKCPVCQYCHYAKPNVDKHMADLHPQCKNRVFQMIRRTKPVDTGGKQNKKIVYKWRCNICPKALFDTRDLVKQHLDATHRLSRYQYQCLICSFQNDTKNIVKEHIASVHNASDTEKIRTIYERVESDADVTPIWQRDDPNRVKHIRGILFEEEETNTASVSEDFTDCDKTLLSPRHQSIHLDIEPVRFLPKLSTLTKNSNRAATNLALIPASTSASTGIQTILDNNDAKTFRIITTGSNEANVSNHIIQNKFDCVARNKRIEEQPRNEAVNNVIDSSTSMTTTTKPAKISLKKSKDQMVVTKPKCEEIYRARPAALRQILKRRSSMFISSASAPNVPVSTASIKQSISLPVKHVKVTPLIKDAATVDKVNLQLMPPSPLAKQSISNAPELTSLNLIYLCNYCEDSADTFDAIHSHWLEKHKKISLSDLASSNNVTAKRFYYRITAKVQCIYCTESVTFHTIRNHVYKLHLCQPYAFALYSPNAKTDHLQCGNCSVSVKGIFGMQKHFRDKHPYNGQFEIKIEPMTWLNDSILEQLLQQGDCGTFRCLRCSTYFPCRYDLEQHYREKHASNSMWYAIDGKHVVKYGCNICRDIFTDANRAIEHIRSHLKQMYQCNFCSIKFVYLKFIEKHQATHHHNHELAYRIVNACEDLQNYYQMTLTFSNGLMLILGDLINTKYGSMDQLMDVNNKLNDSICKQQISSLNEENKVATPSSAILREKKNFKRRQTLV